MQRELAAVHLDPLDRLVQRRERLLHGPEQALVVVVERTGSAGQRGQRANEAAETGGVTATGAPEHVPRPFGGLLRLRLRGRIVREGGRGRRGVAGRRSGHVLLRVGPSTRSS